MRAKGLLRTVLPLAGLEQVVHPHTLMVTEQRIICRPHKGTDVWVAFGPQAHARLSRLQMTTQGVEVALRVWDERKKSTSVVCKAVLPPEVVPKDLEEGFLTGFWLEAAPFVALCEYIERHIEHWHGPTLHQIGASLHTLPSQEKMFDEKQEQSAAISVSSRHAQ